MKSDFEKKAYTKHLQSSSDLQTSRAAYRAGFVSLALEKNRRATPFIDEARKLKAAASEAKAPAGLLRLKTIQRALLTAAGVSEKAAGHLEDVDKNEAINGLIRQFLEPAGNSFVEELVYRFLLTRGDALGGSMRNVGGALAQRKLTRSIISCLTISGKKYWWMDKKNYFWSECKSPIEDADIEINLRGLSWKNESGDRTLIYNLTVPSVKNNIDMCLMDVPYNRYCADIIKKSNVYLALGELKGGIDPAGADEHWKTARTALDRIHKGFAGHYLETFFVGAAIEKKMSSEIWDMLERGVISNAANLTNEDQVSSIANWLCQL